MIESREELLRRARNADEPDAIDEERVLRALQDAIASGQMTPLSEQVAKSLREPGALSAALAVPGVKLLGAVLVLVSVVAAGVLLRRARQESAPVVAPAAQALRLPELPRGAAVPESARSEVEADAPTAGQSGGDAGGIASHAPEVARAQRVSRRRTLAPAAAEQGEQAHAELALLRRVQAALRRHDGAAALAALDAQPRAPGLLQAELEAARILALCLLDRGAEARAAAARFVVDHPASPQLAAIDASCANSSRNGAP